MSETLDIRNILIGISIIVIIVLGIGYLGQELLVIDEQETDISEGRFPDMDENWIFFESPTPGASNESTSINEIDSEIVKVFPNPSKGGIVSLSKPSNFKIFNAQGIIIEEFNFSQFFNTSKYNNGLYIVVMESGQTIKLIVQ